MNLKINEGITSAQIKQLIRFSNEDEIILRTTKDKVRFRSISNFNIWQEKKRKIYTLIGNKDKLLGIIWFGKELIPSAQKNYQFTFAIRIYEPARGKGNALPFMKTAIEKFKKTDDYRNSAIKGFWLITSFDNLAAIKAYENFGFKKIPYKNDEGKILMVTESL